MGKLAIYEELDEAIECLLTDGNAPRLNGELAEVISLAGELRTIPSADFRSRLRSDLEDQAMFIAAGKTYRREIRTSKVLQMPRPMPALFAQGPAPYPVSRANFMMSFLLHTAALALLVTSGVWTVSQRPLIKQQAIALVDPGDIVVTVSASKSGGGGGGGDLDKTQAPQGKLPKQAMTQITPPAMVIRSEHPKLAVEPTVVAPPINIAANMPNLGDPFSKVPLGPASNGPGSGGGIGSGSAGGVGSGYGPGVGPGFGGGMGGGPYRVGGGVSAPHVLYAPDPDYSDEARKAKYQGTVMLWLVVGPDGRPRDVKIARSLGMGLDERALAAVKQWRFDPSRLDGRPVSVQINVEVNFRLY